VEERVGVAEGGFAQSAEAVEEPRFEVVFAGVDVDGEVDVVGDEHGRGGAALQDVEAFEDDDVGMVERLLLVGEDVVLQV
jgi:hypothetical protein